MSERWRRIRNYQFSVKVYPMSAWCWSVTHWYYGQIGHGRTLTKVGARLAAWRCLWFGRLTDE